MILTLFLLLALCLNRKNPLPEAIPEARQQSGSRADTDSTLNHRRDLVHEVASAGNVAMATSFTPRTQGHFTLLSHSPGEWRFRFELGEYRVEEVEHKDGRYSRIHSEGAWFLEQRGKPELPVFRTDFAIPENAAYQLEIVSSDQERIACLPPLPSRGAVPRNASTDLPAVPEANIYQGSSPFPAELTALTEPYQLRKVTGIGLQVTPMQYLPQEGKLLVSRRFEAVLRVRSDADSDLELDKNASFAFLQQENFLNGLQMTRSENRTVGTLLLLLPEAWQEAAADFVLWKKRTGFQVHIARYPVDTGEGSTNIAGHIAEYYASHAVTHVILCGDWNHLPPWRKTSRSDGVPPSASKTAQITTDVPYALLNGQTPDSPDYAADVLLSRISANSATELTTILNKLRQHERGYSDSAWRGTGLFMASNEGFGSFNWNNDFIAGDNGLVQKDHVYIERLRQLLLNQCGYSASSTLYAGSSPAPTSQLVTSNLNSGSSLFYYLGHGNFDSFVTSGFNVSDVIGLSNGTALPFVLSPVCHTGNFAISAGDCLSEALLKHPNGGAAAILASTGETYWRAPIVLLWKFTDSLLEERPALPDTGTAALNSIIEGIRYCQATSDYDESGAQKYFLELMHLFGDCTQVPRLGTAKSLQVEQEWTGDGLLVRVFRPGGSGDIPVSGAKVCLSFGSPEEYVSGCSDETGEILLSVGRDYPLYTLRVLEGGSPLQEIQVPGSPNLDSDEDGVVSHQELLSWLSEWDANPEKPDGVLAAALAQWQAGGSPGTRQGTIPAEQNIPVYAPPEVLLQVACPDQQELNRLADTGANVTGLQNGIAFLECTREFADHLAGEGFSILEISPLGIPTRSLSEYPSCEQVFSELLDVAARYPQFCRPSFVGKSVQGREILALRLSFADSDAEVPELLIAGGIHGDEPPGTEMIMRLMQYLCEQSETGAVQNILQNSVVWLMPLMNPDGRALGTRTNANNADLNRNFPDGVVLGAENLGTYAAGSSLRLEDLQPEQVVMMRWLSARRITAALHLHTGDLKVCYPYGNYLNNLQEAISPDDATFRQLSLQYAGLNSDMSENDVINAAAWYRVTGELADWQYRFLGTLPLTLELVGPYTNKAPAYSTMSALWEANRPALLGWIEEIRSLYPQGLPAPTRSDEGAWQANYFFERVQYVPGYTNLAWIRFCDFAEATPTALILVSKIPEHWAIAGGSGGLQVLASRPEGNQQTAWLFYPGAEGWGSDEAPFGLMPPENTAAEALFSADLFWDGGSWCSPNSHWLPLPERDFELNWASGWNSLSFPLKIKISQPLPFRDLWEWNQNRFRPAAEIRPGQGYYGYAMAGGNNTYSGWMTEENPPPMQSGWNLQSVLWKRFADPQEQILLQPTRSAPVRPADPERVLPPGKTFWHLVK